VATSPLRLTCRTEARRIVVEVFGARPAADVLEDLADRLGAVDARLEHVVHGDGAPVLRAEIPCAS
jgi:hypothetical protein